MSDPYVRQIQQLLTDLSPLSPGPLDGIWGEKTKASMSAFLFDPTLTGAAQVALLELLQQASTQTTPLSKVDFDFREWKAAGNLEKGDYRWLDKEKTEVALRDRSTVHSICLHQTAVWMGTTPASRRKYGSDTEARARRTKTMPYHGVCFRDSLTLSTPFEWYSYHGSSTNKFSLGFAFEFKDLRHWKTTEGDLPSPPSLPSDMDKDWVELYVERLCAFAEIALEEGFPLRNVVAHRQGSRNRKIDPGEYLWKLAIPELDRRFRIKPLNRKWGTGYLLP